MSFPGIEPTQTPHVLLFTRSDENDTFIIWDEMLSDADAENRQKIRDNEFSPWKHNMFIVADNQICWFEYERGRLWKMFSFFSSADGKKMKSSRKQKEFHFKHLHVEQKACNTKSFLQSSGVFVTESNGGRQTKEGFRLWSKFFCSQTHPFFLQTRKKYVEDTFNYFEHMR